MTRCLAFALMVMVVTTALFAYDDILPKPISAELPTYPETARTARVAGSVKLWFVLNGEGRVIQAGSTSGVPLLRDSALANLKTWKFGRRTFKPNVKYETEYIYRLDVQQQAGEPRLTISIVDARRVEIGSELYVHPIE
jgi:hypothetical protein